MAKGNTLEASWPATKVELWPLEKIKKYAKNPKKHPPEQVRELAGLMKEFGVTENILLDENGEILHGHGRMEAAELNGWPRYPVAQAIGWTEAQKTAYRLAHNVIGSAYGAELIPAIVETDLGRLEELNYDIERFGLDQIALPELEEIPAVTRRARSTTTIFVSIKNEFADKARKIVADALTRAKIPHNL